MSRYKYIGECAAGSVTFNRPMEDPVVMPTGEAVEVPDWLAAKLAANSHFEEVSGGKAKVDQEEETGECPDCGNTFRLTKEGYLYKHKCVGD